MTGACLRQPAVVPKQTERKLYVIHNSGSIDNPVVAGHGHRLHLRLLHSYPAGGCGHYDIGQPHFRPQGNLGGS
jgi:hypothetical protein